MHKDKRNKIKRWLSSIDLVCICICLVLLTGCFNKGHQEHRYKVPSSPEVYHLTPTYHLV